MAKCAHDLISLSKGAKHRLSGVDTAILQILFLILLIAINAFFVAAEAGLFRIKRIRVEQLAEGGNKAAELIRKELDDPDRFISACQLGITIATLVMGAIAEKAFAEDLIAFVKELGVIATPVLPFAHALCFGGAFLLTTFLQTTFGEILPKTLTFQRAEQVLLVLIWPMSWWCTLTAFPLYLLRNFTALVLRILNIKDPPRRHYVHTGEELRMLVSESQEEGIIEEKEEEMLHSVFDFANTQAQEVMTPHTDMVCVSANTTIKDFIKLALKHGHSRLPVYEEDIDSIFGAVHIRDGLRAIIEHKENSQVREFARKVLIIPENKDAGDLLTEFKKTKTHMAIIVDEYGGTRGLVTIEDLIEELVGDIADEHEIVEEFIQQQKDGTYLLDAKVALDDLNKQLEINIEDEEFNTLGGHVFGLLGREPKVGDEVEGKGYVLCVEEADRHRILKLRLTKVEIEEAEETVENENKEIESANGELTKLNANPNKDNKDKLPKKVGSRARKAATNEDDEVEKENKPKSSRVTRT